jgi:hypothetical protein
MNIQAIDWVTNYNGFIGSLSNSMASNWLEVIQANLSNVKQQEIDDAVASLCTEQRPFNSAKPNALSIISKIKEMRGYRMNQGFRPTSNYVSYIDGNNKMMHTTMAELKSFLRRRPDPVEAWDIICTPLEADQCKELHRYADEHNIHYERFAPCIASKVDAIVSQYQQA